jgi:formylmethanofuran dehydrogenase subunit E
MWRGRRLTFTAVQGQTSIKSKIAGGIHLALISSMTTSVVDMPLTGRNFDALLTEAVRFHGHLCPGQVLGVRMALAGCAALGLDRPRSVGKRLVVFVEIDRCATDAIQVVTGVSLGKRTLKHIDHGKMAATFVDVVNGAARRVVARDDARERASEWAPGESDPRRTQVVAYRRMPDELLLAIQPVTIRPGWLDRQRVRVSCAVCGEGINYQREVLAGGRVVCRACAGHRYYAPLMPQ